jgi:hypothetical protein
MSWQQQAIPFFGIMLQSSKNVHICPEEKYSSALKKSCSLASLHKTISIGVYICIFHKSQSRIKGTESELYVSYKYKTHLGTIMKWILTLPIAIYLHIKTQADIYKCLY